MVKLNELKSQLGLKFDFSGCTSPSNFSGPFATTDFLNRSVIPLSFVKYRGNQKKAFNLTFNYSLVTRGGASDSVAFTTFLASSKFAPVNTSA